MIQSVWKISLRAPSSALEDSLHLLQTCLADDPDHVEALWCLAAVRSALGDREGLAAQAAAMNRPGVRDARFHYLGAVCHLAARDYPLIQGAVLLIAAVFLLVNLVVDALYAVVDPRIRLS